MTNNSIHHLLDDYVVGMLTPAGRKEFEEHLKTCVSCSDELRKIESVRKQIADLHKEIQPPHDLWPAIRTGLHDHAESGSAERKEPSADSRHRATIFRLSPWYLRAAAALLIIILSGAILLFLLSKKADHGVPEQRIAQSPNSAPPSLSLKTEPRETHQRPPSELPQSKPTPHPSAAAGEHARSESFVTPAAGTEVLDHLRVSFARYVDRFPADRVYLHTDRPFYSPGETIWFQAYVRNETDLRASDQSGVVHVELISPKGSPVSHMSLLTRDGVASGDITLSEGIEGGLYKLRAFTQWQKNLPEAYSFEKEIQIQDVVLPQLKMKLEFERKAFGAGDNVIARLDVNTLENKPLANYQFRYLGQITGRTFIDTTATTDGAGRAYITFDLPKPLSSADGILGIVIDHEGQTESISRSIPIVLNNIRFTMYPEGGDLVSGIRSRVAFQALNEFDKPADVEGTVFDNLNRKVTSFSSYHQGMGVFTIMPDIDRGYYVKITKPAGIDRRFVFPDVLPRGYTLGVQYGKRGQANFVVRSTESDRLSIIAQMRGKIVFTQQFSVRHGSATIPFPTRDLPAGVVQATLFDGHGVEQAERLLFVNRSKLIRVTISTDKDHYLPRERVNLTIKATDRMGTPASGNFSLAVVDDKLLSFADDKSGNILAKMLLEPDVQGKVEEPNFYFDPKERKADTALDYLMMTRGWRRFIWKQALADSLPPPMYRAERAMIAGKVVDWMTGNPIPGAAVSVESPVHLSVTTDTHGRFLLRGVNTDWQWKVTVAKAGYQTRALYVRKETDSLLCGLVPQDQPLMLTGRVVDEKTGKPLRGSFVSVVGTALGATTDSSGRYEISNLSPSDSIVRAERAGYAFQQFPVRIAGGATAEVNFQLKPRPGNDVAAGPGKITGRITDEKSKEPVVGVNVIVVGTTRGAVSDVDGRYTILGVPLGSYAVRASLLGYEARTGSVNITRNETSKLDFIVSPQPEQLQGVGIVADRQLVNALSTSSTVAVRGKGAEPAPKDKKVDDLLKAQAGIVRQGNNLYLRGGRANEYIVDGVPAEQKRDRPAVGGERMAAAVAGKPAMAPQVVRGGGFGFSPLYYRAREFPAPDYSAQQTPSVRDDFRPTIFWKGDVTLGARAETTISFYNSDEITSFRATVEGISNDGVVGHAEKTYYTQLPFSLAAKVPVEVSTGDKILVPLTLSNNTKQALKGALTLVPPENWRELDTLQSMQVIDPRSSRTIYVPFQALDRPGKGLMTVAFESDALHDAFEQEVTVRGKGFPQTVSFASSDRDHTYSIHIGAPIAGTLRANVTAYPSVSSNILTAVEAMLQEPSGCFEQASSRNYPNVIALQYLRENNTKDPELSSRAMKLLEDGYKRLTSYETKEKGYEWFGSTPPHEALTAYGLMEFKDMEPVYASVDKAMVGRTGTWLMSRRDGKGGFLRDPRALDSFGRASAEVTNAYIVYALAEAGYNDIGLEIEAAYRNALASDDPYQLALVANALLSSGRKDRAGEVISHLMATRQNDGSWTGKTGSITCSGGASLKIETTALAIMALLKSGSSDAAVVDAGIKFVLGSRSGRGGFGSTQGTILALKALTEYSKFSARTPEAGTLQVAMDGKKIESKSYQTGERGPLVIDSLETYLGTAGGDHALTVSLGDAKHPLPTSVLVTWNTTLPRSSDSARVTLDTRLMHSSVRMGETVRLTTELRNRTDQGLPMTIAIVGIPGGLSAQPWQLKELQEKGKFDFYEITGRYVTFYYRQMKPDETRVINLDLKAEIPGIYESPASSAYLYYTNEFKSWSSAGAVEVKTP